ncbi:unnamed protein product, partial [Didymodactylos carnosus]
MNAHEHLRTPKEHPRTQRRKGKNTQKSAPNPASGYSGLRVW